MRVAAEVDDELRVAPPTPRPPALIVEVEAAPGRRGGGLGLLMTLALNGGRSGVDWNERVRVESVCV